MLTITGPSSVSPSVTYRFASTSAPPTTCTPPTNSTYFDVNKIPRNSPPTPGGSTAGKKCKNAFDPNTTNTSPTSTCAIIVAIFISPPTNSQAWSTPKLGHRSSSKLIQLTDKVTHS